MNIRQAKEQVKYSVIAYLSKDNYGEYSIPVERQRPIFLMGPPGIGKTDIMTQIAEEMNIALVSYSMTHHTRQSALGLPFISNKEYDGEEYRTTEYTMSEIIASVYDVMEETGKKEGILFLDEINCISETLAPSMLQFLQFKTFGKHRVPDGWVIVTAGNPPEYNNSVRDFDLATMDRLKRIDIDPDFKAWWKYAQNSGVHTSILTYLEIKKEDFYSVQTTVDGLEFVTARGWVDLSEMMKLYENNHIQVNLELIRQYIHDERIARDFSAYYDLFYRFREEYYIDDILKGNIREGVLDRAKSSRFDERLTVIRLFMDAMHSSCAISCERDAAIRKVMTVIKANNTNIAEGTIEEAIEWIDATISSGKEELRRERTAKSVSAFDVRVSMAYENILKDMAMELRSKALSGGEDAVQAIREFLATVREKRQSRASEVGNELENAFAFIEEAYGENEMLIFVTALTEDRYSAEYIHQYGSDSYFKYNERLLLFDREQSLMERITNLEEEE